ncbi:MAG: hypothetical protein CVU05_14645 [Bacteroidetes bacterium HGW-Bacteroidetes-21]|jgi:RHS repeat-associated protein|nr:MAG: hypothetical protein CVU05_14645 [Bacteroidetes bacterium HGW-Bacteroidetes-21]
MFTQTFAYGENKFSCSNTRRYCFGFNGQEKDDEITGWTGSHLDFGERIYDSRIARFMSADPLIVYGQKYPELTPYQFASNTPIQAIDLDGLEGIILTLWDPKYYTGEPEIQTFTAEEASNSNLGDVMLVKVYSQDKYGNPITMNYRSRWNTATAIYEGYELHYSEMDNTISRGTTYQTEWEGHHDCGLSGNVYKSDYIAAGKFALGFFGGPVIWALALNSATSEGYSQSKGSGNTGDTPLSDALDILTGTNQGKNLVSGLELLFTGRSIFNFYKNLQNITTLENVVEPAVKHTSDGISTAVSGSDLINNNSSNDNEDQ